MPLTPGQRLASYEIITSLGTGGMGEVYRARDSKLGRDVALKVLPPDVIKEAGRLERFDREARAIAALNHPHIVTIFSTEEADGIRFLTMELVEGHTLTDLVISTGMAVTRFLDIAIPLADALAAAHQKQITHRDLKPGNVMVSNDGRVKVLDFGLARVGSSEHGEQTLIETLAPITHQGVIVGTMPYMSPEQVEGRPIDARSDLFSLGVIFYELLSGGRPFKGASSPALMSAILRDTPPPLAESRTDVPDAIERLITRLIEKRPEDRVQTARDVFNELKHVRKQLESGSSRSSSVGRLPRSASIANARVSVSVRAFVARGADDESKALAESLSDDIRNGLAKFGNLRVLAASQEARYIVEGQVRRSGGLIRVSCSLTDTQASEHLWAEQIDRDLAAGIFVLQDDITSRIVATIGDPTGVLTRSIAAAAADRPYEQLSVLELIARYHAYTERFRSDEHLRLRDAFEAALEREAMPAEAWAALSLLYWQEHTSKYNPRPDAPARQRMAAERAVEIDPHNQQAWLAMASSQRYARDLAAVRAAVDRAIRVNPLNADGLAHGGLHLAGAGDYDRALELTRRAIELKPHHPGWYHLATWCSHFAKGEYAEALREAKQISNSQIPLAAVGAAAAAGFLNRPADARPAIDALRADAPALLDPTAAREAWSMRLLDETLLDQIEDGFGRALQMVESAGALSAISAARPPSSASGGVRSSAIKAGDSLAIAVLPFTVRGSDPDAEAIAVGLTDDIATSIAKFPGMTVVAAQTTRGFKDSTLDVRQIADRVHARYVITGTLRRSGQTLRTTALLIDARSGEQLWTDNYDRQLGDTFAVQDDLTDHIVATVADSNGVLARSMVQSVQSASIHECTNAQLLVHSWASQHRPTPEFHAELRAELESRLERSPDDAHLWAELASIYIMEHQLWFNPLPDPLGRALNAARRATELDRLNQTGWQWLAVTQFHLKNRVAFEEARDRAVRLNPRNSYALAWMGAMTTNAGEYERGCAMVERAMAINPAHPGWLHFSIFDRHMADGDFEQALHAAKRVNMREFFWMYFAIAAACGHLGRSSEGKAAAAEMVRLAPPLADEANLREFVTRWYWSEELIETLVAGVLAAHKGERSDVRSDDRSTARSTVAQTKPPSSASGSRLSVTVAVKPFTSRAAESLAPLAEGVTEDLATNLARFGYLRVVTRVESARFVVEGGVRLAGSQVRLTARLLDTQTSEHLWAETIERPAADLSAAQDEMAARVAATIADEDGVIGRALAEPLMGRSLDSLTIDELVLRFNLHTEQFEHTTHSELITLFEDRVTKEPAHSMGWAVLSVLYGQAIMFGLDLPADAVQRQMHAADRAVSLDSKNQEAWVAVAIKATLARDLAMLREATERCVAINPLSGHTNVGCATYLAMAGDYDRALAIYQQCKPLIAHHQDWYYLVPMLHAYDTKQYAEALSCSQRITAPQLAGYAIVGAAAAAQLGRNAEARTALDLLGRLKPELLDPDTARLVIKAWLWNDSDAEAIVDGFRKAKELVGARSDVRSDVSSGLRSGITVTIRPFAVSGAEPAREIADALSSDLRAALARFSYVRVVDATAATPARYAVEGAVRVSGGQVRINAHLVAVSSGEHVWTDSYTRDATAGAMAIVDDVAGIIAATTGDVHGAIFRAFAASVTDARETAQMQLVLRLIEYNRNHTAAEHAALAAELRTLVAAEPDNARAWAYLAILCAHEVMFGFNEAPDALARAEQAVERGMACDSNVQTVWIARALVAFVKRDAGEMRAAISRSIEINPLHTGTLANAGSCLAWSGDSDRGTPLLKRAIALNANHPGWYRTGLFLDAFARGADAEAFDECKRLAMPHTTASLLALAAAGRFGRPAEAAAAIADLKRRSPELLDTRRAADVFGRLIWEGPLLDSLIEGFSKGLGERAAGPRSDVLLSPVLVSIRPFRGGGSTATLLADGLTTDIATRIARFAFVRVVAPDVIEKSAQRHRYAIEGEVRESGNTIRTYARLIDLASGAQLWAQHYDADATQQTFDIIDGIADRIVVTVADGHGELWRALSQDPALASNLVVRYFSYIRHLKPEDHASLRDAYEAAVDEQPNSAELLARLSVLYTQELMLGFNARPDSAGRARRASERAVSLDAGNYWAWFGHAMACFLTRDVTEFVAATERAIELNPLSSAMLGTLGAFLTYSGRTEQGATLVRRALALTPHQRPWFFVALFTDAFMKGEADEAFAHAQRMASPQLPYAKLFTIAAAGKFGRAEAAARHIEEWRLANDNQPFDVEACSRVLQLTIWPGPLFDALIAGLRTAGTLAATMTNTASDAGREQSIAVLPFTDLSEKKDQDWFCDGIAEEIMSSLAPIPGLRVAARASAFSFRGKADDLAMIAEKLHVDTVLEGSVRRAGDRVRITTQLSDAKQGKVLWSERFDRELKDIFDVQEEIARAIVDRLRIAVTGGAHRIVAKSTTNIEAYELLLKGRTFLYRRGPAIANAIECFEQAIAIDPNLADAHAGVGDAYRLLGIYGLLPSHEAMHRSRQSLERALAIEPDQVEALATLANIKSAFEWRPEEARALSDRAIALDPGHARALMESAVTLAVTKKEPASDALNNLILERTRRARAVDPLGAWTMAISAMVLMVMHRDEEAADLAVKALATDPNNFTAHWARVFTLARLKRRTEAKAAAEAALPMSRRHPTMLGELAALHAMDGDRASAEAIYQELVGRSSTSYVSPASLANAAMAAGAKEDARRYLAQALADHDAGITFYKLPAFELLWNDPECADLFEQSELFANRPS